MSDLLQCVWWRKPHSDANLQELLLGLGVLLACSLFVPHETQRKTQPQRAVSHLARRQHMQTRHTACERYTHAARLTNVSDAEVVSEGAVVLAVTLDAVQIQQHVGELPQQEETRGHALTAGNRVYANATHSNTQTRTHTNACTHMHSNTH